VFASLGGKPGCRVFLEERQQLRGFDVFGVRVCARGDDPKDVLRSQDGQCIRHGRARDGGEKQMTSGLQWMGLEQVAKACVRSAKEAK
jgi:hypothetical protein